MLSELELSRSRPGRRQAFTMVEIFIALLILVLGLIPLYETFVSSSRDAKKNRNRSYAAVLAASVLERYRGCIDLTKPDTPLAHLDKLFAAQSEYQAAMGPGNKATRHKGDSVPKELDKDPILTPWTPDGTSKVKGAGYPDSPYFTQFNDVIKDRFRRLAYLDWIENGRVGRLVCTVVWREESSVVGYFSPASDPSKAPGWVEASYTLGVFAGSSFFPAGKQY